MYRMLLWLAFPRRLRRIFGDDMTRLFNAQREEVRASGGSMMRLWADAVRDALLQGTAERLKQIEHGGLAVARELRRWRWWMRAFIQDVRYAIRLLGRQPGVTIVVMLHWLSASGQAPQSSRRLTQSSCDRFPIPIPINW